MGTDVTMLPLEQMMYLLNVQWVCRGNTGYLYRWSEKDGKLEELDSHPMAGGGDAYYNE